MGGIGKDAFTNSERRVQRVRKAIEPPDGARDDLAIIFELARRGGRDWGAPDAEALWNELRTLSPVHAGMSYARLEAEGGLQWPCYDEHHPVVLPALAAVGGPDARRPRPVRARGVAP